MKMAHGLKMQVLKLNYTAIILIFFLSLVGLANAKTLKVDTVTPSITNGDFTITPNGTGDIVIGSGSGFVKLTSGILSNQTLIDVTSEVSGVLPIANGGTGSSTQNFVDLTTAQTVSGVKTLSDLLDANNGADIEGNMTLAGNLTMEGTGVLQLPVGTTAQRPTPAEGMIRRNSTTAQFEGYDGSSWQELGGGGQGGINYIDNFDIEIDTTGYATFDDASAYVDGTGGTASNLTLTRNTTTPLRETGDLKLVQAAVASPAALYEGFSYDFTIDKGQQAQMLTGSFWYDASDADYVDDDIRIFIYDKTNAQIIRVNGEDLKGGKGVHYFQFQTAPDSTSYRISFMVNQENTAGFSIYFDQIAVSPTRLARGAIVTEWEIYTPTTQGLGSPTNLNSKWRRVGDTLELSAHFTTGTTSADELQIGLPSGLSIDTGYNAYVVGEAQTRASNVSHFSVLATTGDTYFNVGLRSTGTDVINTPQNGNALFGSTLYVSFNAKVKIAGWESSGTLNEDLGGGDVVVDARGCTTCGTVTDLTPYNWTEVKDTTASFDGETFTTPETGCYKVSGSLNLSGNITGNVLAYVNGSNYRSLNDFQTNSIMSFAGELDLTKGQALTFRHPDSASASITNSTPYHWLRISKCASGSQKFETATVAARYTSNSGTNTLDGTQRPVVYEDLEVDKTGSYNSSTGVYTIPVGGYYCFVATVRSGSVAWSIGDALTLSLDVDGTNEVFMKQDLHDVGSTRAKDVNLSGCDDFNRGQELTIESQASQSTTTEANPRTNSFSIWRVK